MRTYTCEACGAKLLVSEISHVTNCLYCGNTIVIHNEEIDNLNIKKMIPFQIEKEEAMKKVSYYTSDTPVDAKKIYVPVKFASFHYDYLYYFKYEVEHTDDDGGTTYTYHDADILLDGDAEREIIFGTSKINTIYHSFEYQGAKTIDYNPTLIEDVSIELSDFSNIDLKEKQKERLKDYTRSYFRNYDIVRVYSENYFFSNTSIDSYTTLVPVYVVKTEKNLVYNIPGIKTQNPQKSINSFLGVLVAFLAFFSISLLLATEYALIGKLLILAAVVGVIYLSQKDNKGSFDGFKTKETQFSTRRKRLR